MSPLLGVILVVLAGLGTGTFVWPMKLQKRFQFEHWFFVAMLVGLIIMPIFMSLWVIIQSPNNLFLWINKVAISTLKKYPRL